jgi:hypothetical protein
VTGVTAGAPDVTAVTRNGVTPPPDLLARPTEAADGDVAPGAVDVAPIQTLLAAGCDLDLDVLPVAQDSLSSIPEIPPRRSVKSSPASSRTQSGRHSCAFLHSLGQSLPIQSRRSCPVRPAADVGQIVKPT